MLGASQRVVAGHISGQRLSWHTLGVAGVAARAQHSVGSCLRSSRGYGFPTSSSSSSMASSPPLCAQT
eukprot:5853955-Pyramimonas_sp.AAC.1